MLTVRMLNVSADTRNAYCPHVKCVSGQCNTALVFCVISNVLLDDDSFRVETCRSD
jgi:hypothetical protein